jgi:hypothetical protein
MRLSHVRLWLVRHIRKGNTVRGPKYPLHSLFVLLKILTKSDKCYIHSDAPNFYTDYSVLKTKPTVICMTLFLFRMVSDKEIYYHHRFSAVYNSFSQISGTVNNPLPRIVSYIFIN